MTIEPCKLDCSWGGFSRALGSWLSGLACAAPQRRGGRWQQVGKRRLGLIDQRALGIVRAGACIVIWQWITALLLEDL